MSSTPSTVVTHTAIVVPALCMLSHTLNVLGTSIGSMGVLHGIHKITAAGVKLMMFFPQWVGSEKTPKSAKITADNDEGDKVAADDDQAILTRAGLRTELTACCKILGAILLGAAVKFAGINIAHQSVLDFVTGIFQPRS
jgi:hypothetical protein